MCVPGAIKSGARQPLPQLAALAEYEATWSSQGAAVPAHREDLRIVRRVGEALGARALLVAGVAGRRDDDDARLPRLLHCVRERVALVRLRRVRAVREVEDADVHPVVVAVLDDPVDRRDHLGDVDTAVGHANLERDDACVGGYAAVAPRLAVVAGDQPGHERPVAVRVEVLQTRILGFEGEVRSVDHLAGGVEARYGRDACVDDCDVDAVAGVPRLPPRLHAVSRCDALRRVRIGRRVVGGRAPRGARADHAERDYQHDCEKTYLPGAET